MADKVKKIQIIYDVDGKPVDLAINKTLNLQQQVKLLTAELRRTKEGTAEFALLSSRLGDAQDQLAKTTAKSKDLFSSLSLLPGPVGQFFAQLQGGIELLKTFSSFSFKDLRFQFKETLNDIKDIVKNLTGFNNTKNSIDTVKESANELGDKLAETATDAAATSGAISNSAESFKKQRNELVHNIEAFRNQITGNKEFTASTKSATGAVEGFVAAEKTATFWTSTLGKTIQAALIATGIGLLIVILFEAISLLYKFAAGEKEAEEATQSLNEALEEQQRILNNDIDAIDMSTKMLETRAKIAGKTEAEISKIQIKGGQERLDALRKYDEQLYQLQRDATNNTKITEEQRTKLLEDINAKILKNGQDITKQILANEQLRLNEKLRIAEAGRASSKKISEDELNDNKRANDLLLKLQQENSVNRLKTERERQDKQMMVDKQNEEREVNNLKIKEELRGRILEQIRIKYGLKVIEINKKRQEEDNKIFQDDQKKLKEYQDKIFEILNSGDQNELARAKRARTRKFEDDKEALQADLNFQKQSLETKIAILLALEKAYRQDLQKLDDDDAAKKREANLKRLDDELRFLQIRGEAVIQGTREYFQNLRTISQRSEERELKALEDRAIKEKMTAEEVEREKTELKKKYARERTNIDKQELNSYLQFANQILSAAQNVVSDIAEVNRLQEQVDLQNAEGNLQKQDEIKKKYFEKNKKTQIAQAVIGTLQAAVQAFQSLAVIPVVGPALGAAAAAAALVFGYKKVQLIKQQEYQSSTEGSGGAPANLPNYGRNYEDGGLINGPRHSSAQGGVPIMAEGGEAIMTRGAVTMFRPLLSAMNVLGGGTAFQPGAIGYARPDEPKLSKPAEETEPIILKTYVVENELTSLQQRQARLKNLSTI